MSFLSAASPDSADLEEEMLEELVDAETASDPAVGLVGTLSTCSWSALSWGARTLRSSYGWATGSAEQNELSQAALDDPESANVAALLDLLLSYCTDCTAAISHISHWRWHLCAILSFLLSACICLKLGTDMHHCHCYTVLPVADCLCEGNLAGV